MQVLLRGGDADGAVYEVPEPLSGERLQEPPEYALVEAGGPEMWNFSRA